MVPLWPTITTAVRSFVPGLKPDKNGKRKAMYEPVHGSAPDIAGKGIANPIAMIASFGMALRYSFNMGEAADMVDKAIANVLAAGLRTAERVHAHEALAPAGLRREVLFPTYGLAEHKPAAVTAAVVAWSTGDREVVPTGRGFMGRGWDAFVPPPAVWDECLRVLKPGGLYLQLSFGQPHFRKQYLKQGRAEDAWSGPVEKKAGEDILFRVISERSSICWRTETSMSISRRREALRR